MKGATIIFSLICYFGLIAQKELDTVITFPEEEYDQSYISPSLRGKHSFSFGFVNVQTTPDENFEVNQSLHFGYNYLILKERKLLLAFKDKYRTEMNSIGVHFTYVNPREHYVMGTLFNSYLAKKGRFISFYFLSEVGLGYHYKEGLKNFGQNRVNLTLLLDFMKIRVGRIPMYMHFSGTYALSNDLFGKSPIILGYMAGVRYYFYFKK